MINFINKNININNNKNFRNKNINNNKNFRNKNKNFSIYDYLKFIIYD